MVRFFRVAAERFLQPAIVDLAVVVHESVDDTAVLLQELLRSEELVVRALQGKVDMRIAAVKHQADRAGKLSIGRPLVLDAFDVVALFLATETGFDSALVSALFALSHHVDGENGSGNGEDRPTCCDCSAGGDRLQHGMRYSRQCVRTL